MKKIVSVLLSAVLLFSSVVAFAADTVDVMLDGKLLEFDVPAQIIDDRTMVPMRKIFESLDSDVTWISETKTILATKDSKIIAMSIGSEMMIVTDVMEGDKKQIILDVPPVIVGDRTLVPARAISEALGYNVGWDGDTRTVLITK